MKIEIAVLIVSFSLSALLYVIYTINRNFNVGKYRLYIVKICDEFIKRNPEKAMQESPYDWFYGKLPSYSKQLHSFKKLDLESYFTKEEIERIQS